MKSLQHYNLHKGNKRVAFDIGNVLCHVDMERFITYLSEEYYNVWSSQDAAKLFIDSIQASQDLGILTMEHGLYHNFPYLPIQDILDIQAAWKDTVSLSEPMIDLIEKLIANNWHVALLSNIGKDHASVIRESHHIFDWCYRHFSCDVGARKPTKLYFQSFIQDCGWDTNDPFFDDRVENIQASRRYLDGHVFNLDDYENDEAAASALESSLFD